MVCVIWCFATGSVRHWERAVGRLAGWLFGPSDSLSRDYWFRLWSESRRQVFRWDEFWLGACPFSKGNRSRLKEKGSLAHATYHMISKGQASNLRIRKESSPTHLRLADKYALLTITEQNNSLRQKASQQSTDVNVESLKRRSPWFTETIYSCCKFHQTRSVVQLAQFLQPLSAVNSVVMYDTGHGEVTFKQLSSNFTWPTSPLGNSFTFKRHSWLHGILLFLTVCRKYKW